jgi:hypothetical protein
MRCYFGLILGPPARCLPNAAAYRAHPRCRLAALTLCSTKNCPGKRAMGNGSRQLSLPQCAPRLQSLVSCLLEADCAVGLQCSPSRVPSPNLPYPQYALLRAALFYCRDAPDFVSTSVIVDAVAKCRMPDALSPSPNGHQLDTRTVSCSEPLANECKTCLALITNYSFHGPDRPMPKAAWFLTRERCQLRLLQSGVLEAKVRLHHRRTTTPATVSSALEVDGVARTYRRILGWD